MSLDPLREVGAGALHRFRRQLPQLVGFDDPLRRAHAPPIVRRTIHKVLCACRAGRPGLRQARLGAPVRRPGLSNSLTDMSSCT